MSAATMVLSTSPEAAEYRTDIKGWMSGGRYFGDGRSAEQIARYDGCTHVICNTCKTKTVEKRWTACGDCRELKRAAKFQARPLAEWNGTDLLFSEAADVYFSGWSEIADYLGDHDDVDLIGLDLVICEPTFVHQVDPNELYQDSLPEDGEVDSVIEEAFKRLNATLAAHREPMCWTPGEGRADMSAYIEDAAKVVAERDGPDIGDDSDADINE